MDIEQPVVGVDDVCSIDKQAKVPGFVRGDVQRANRHHIGFGSGQALERIGFHIGGGRGALAIVHRVFA
ncbi:hypothetical protein D3C78_1521030 [compost metagenome]